MPPISRGQVLGQEATRLAVQNSDRIEPPCALIVPVFFHLADEPRASAFETRALRLHDVGRVVSPARD